MTTHPANPALVSGMKTWSKAMAAGALLLGAAVIAGWAFGSEALRDLPPVWANMMPNTALCIIAAAISLWGQQSEGGAHPIARACAWGVVAVGLMTLGEYAFGWETGIDRVLFGNAVSKMPLLHPGRMSIIAASCFVVLGAALSALGVQTERGCRRAQLFALTTACTAMLVLLGHAYGTQNIGTVAGHAKMDLPTALSIALLSVGILLARADRGVMAVLVSDSIGGRMARRFLPTAIGVLMGLGWLRIAGQHAGYYKTEFGTALMTSMNVIIFSALIWRSARSIDATDASRRKAEDSLRAARDELEIRVRERTADLEKQNDEILVAAGSLASSASEILASTSQLAASASETAATVAETTATVEEVKQTSQVSSGKAKAVAEESQRTATVARDGKDAVEKTISGMGRIREQMGAIAESILSLSAQGQAIGEIIATVDDLAAQSKLLAVNASIEAAKAGDEGRGFAVVAQEVRSLAEQSKQATLQVRVILNDIQKATGSAVLATEEGSKQVEAGVRQSASSGESIRALAESIAAAAHASAQIAATSQQQFVGLDQVALAMENIKSASTQSVASTRQAEAVAQQLHQLGQRLTELVGRFKQ